MNFRHATAEEIPAVMNVLDGADLAVSAETVRRRIRGGTVLVAVTEGETPVGVLVALPNSMQSPGCRFDFPGRSVGVLVALPRPQGVHVEAIAVRPGRRGQGIGSDLVAEAADRWGRLTAAFDPSKRDFYRQTGFEVSPTGERCFGERV